MELYAEIGKYSLRGGMSESATELKWHCYIKCLFDRGIFLRYQQNCDTSIVEIVEIGQISEKCFTDGDSFYIIVLKF